jgi:membrane associated rhomboid family serine protease
MSQRFFVYPILFIVLLQLVPLLRRGWPWYAAQISQLFVTLLACGGAFYFSDDPVWVVITWALFVAFVVAPAVLLSLAGEKELQGRWRSAARLDKLAGWMAWGRLGRLYRRHGDALHLIARGQVEQSLTRLEDLAAQPMPWMVHATVHIWRLSLLITLRQWERAVAFYESTHDWGALGQVAQVRLFAARAMAEIGQIERALRSLQFVALSPRTVGAKQTQLWATRIAVTALAGDPDRLEELLRRREYGLRSRKFKRFAAYWRGRCAFMRSQRAEAISQLTQALELTRPGDRLWRDAITEHLRRAESGELPADSTARDAIYEHRQELLRNAEKETAAWRALMHLGRPEPATLSLLLVFAGVYLVGSLFLHGSLQERLWLWGGNTPDTVKNGEWWRVFTALFLHANLLHLGMNGAGLWLFGSAVEKTMGRWRFLAVFLLAGALGNLLSASLARYDVAVGASGGIFGVIGAFAVAVWRLRSPMYFALRRRLLFFLALMVTLDFSIGWLEPQIDNLAHVGGFVAGIVLAAVLFLRLRQDGTRMSDTTHSV